MTVIGHHGLDGEVRLLDAQSLVREAGRVLRDGIGVGVGRVPVGIRTGDRVPTGHILRQAVGGVFDRREDDLARRGGAVRPVGRGGVDARLHGVVGIEGRHGEGEVVGAELGVRKRLGGLDARRAVAAQLTGRAVGVVERDLERRDALAGARRGLGDGVVLTVGDRRDHGDDPVVPDRRVNRQRVDIGVVRHAVARVLVGNLLADRIRIGARVPGGKGDNRAPENGQEVLHAVLRARERVDAGRRVIADAEQVLGGAVVGDELEGEGLPLERIAPVQHLGDVDRHMGGVIDAAAGEGVGVRDGAGRARLDRAAGAQPVARLGVAGGRIHLSAVVRLGRLGHGVVRAVRQAGDGDTLAVGQGELVRVRGEGDLGGRGRAVGMRRRGVERTRHRETVGVGYRQVEVEGRALGGAVPLDGLADGQRAGRRHLAVGHLDGHIAVEQRVEGLIAQILLGTARLIGIVLGALGDVETRPAGIGDVGGIFTIGRDVVERIGRIVVVIVQGTAVIRPRGVIGRVALRGRGLRLSGDLVQRGVDVIARSEALHAPHEAADARLDRDVIARAARVHVDPVVVHDDLDGRFLLDVVTRRLGLDQHIGSLGEDTRPIGAVGGCDVKRAVDARRAREARRLARIHGAVGAGIHGELGTSQRLARIGVGLDKGQLVLDVGDVQRDGEDAPDAVVARHRVRSGLNLLDPARRGHLRDGVGIGPVVPHRVLGGAHISIICLEHVGVLGDITGQVLDGHLVIARRAGEELVLAVLLLSSGDDVGIGIPVRHVPPAESVAGHRVPFAVLALLHDDGEQGPTVLCTDVVGAAVLIEHRRWGGCGHMCLRVRAGIPLVAREQHAVLEA